MPDMTCIVAGHAAISRDFRGDFCKADNIIYILYCLLYKNRLVSPLVMNFAFQSLGWHDYLYFI